MIFFETHNFNLHCGTSSHPCFFLRKVVLIKPTFILQSQMAKTFDVFQTCLKSSETDLIVNVCEYWFYFRFGGVEKCLKSTKKNYFYFHFWKNLLLIGPNAIERFLSFGVLIRPQKKKFDYVEQIIPKRGMKMSLILGVKNLQQYVWTLVSRT